MAESKIKIDEGVIAWYEGVVERTPYADAALFEGEKSPKEKLEVLLKIKETGKANEEEAAIYEEIRRDFDECEKAKRK